MVQLEALLELLDLCRQRHRIGGVAVKHLDGNRTAIGRAQQAIDNLQRALLAVAAVAPLGERAAAPLHVARRHVVQHQRAVGEMALGQRGLDRGLALQQPVQRGVEFVLIDLTEAEQFAEARCGGGGRQRTGGGELGCGIEDAADQQGEDQVAAAIVIRAEDAVETDVARGAERSGDVAVRQAADDGEGLTLGGDDRAALQHTAQTLDVGNGPVGEVAQRALTHLAAFAIALAQQDRGRRVPIRNGFDVHGEACAHPVAAYKSQI